MTRKTFLEWLVLFVAAVLLNCGGQRCLQVIILPLPVVGNPLFAGIRTSPAEAARWTLSCQPAESCAAFPDILSVRRQRRLCSLSAAAGEAVEKLRSGFRQPCWRTLDWWEMQR